ncbi:uncharacterized protein BJ171DRAFT_507846 [Polychytrium aggregatum]|uniref:uncharacterized protein n=1 Tax=Polychytrium aggregatum TaxID=110093 RepID=UPI0022FEE012|nr:uncharacterized protein BJ171DRAFT_507846 [Polychytrium aggregatum]KAI9203750.1 hypothetical protein BJ171DRAFT_507846 [Polychytrium aggregatum]
MLPPCLIRAAGRPSTILRRQAPTIFRALPASQMLSTRMVAADPADTLMPPSSWPPAIPRRWMSSGRPGSRNNDRGPSNDRNSDRRNSDHPSNDRDRSFRSSRSPSASGPSTRPTSRFGSSSRPSSGEKNTKQSHGTHSTQRPWSKEPRTAETHSKHSPKTLSPSLSRPSVQASQALQTPLDPHQAGRPAGRLEWHSDPKNLGTRLKALIRSGQIDEAWDLIDRHTGATNDVVFAEAIQAFKDHGHYGDAIEAFKLYYKRKSRASPELITLGLESIVLYCQSSDTFGKERNDLVGLANSMWNRLVPRTVVQANLFLDLCRSCVYESGWSRGLELFQSMMFWVRPDGMYLKIQPSQSKSADFPPPDPYTFIIILKMCALYRPQVVGFDVGSTVMSQFIKIATNPSYQSRPDSGVHGQPFKVDSAILSAFFDLCAATMKKESRREALALLSRFCDLPTEVQAGASIQETVSLWIKPVPSKVPLSPELMLSLLRFASSCISGPLGRVWFEIFEQRQLQICSDAVNLVIPYYLRHREFERAIRLNEALPTRDQAQNAIKISLSAAKHAQQTSPDSPLDRRWLRLAVSAIQASESACATDSATNLVEYLGIPVYCEYVEVLCAYGDPVTALAEIHARLPQMGTIVFSKINHFCRLHEPISREPLRPVLEHIFEALERLISTLDEMKKPGLPLRVQANLGRVRGQVDSLVASWIRAKSLLQTRSPEWLKKAIPADPETEGYARVANSTTDSIGFAKFGRNYRTNTPPRDETSETSPEAKGPALGAGEQAPSLSLRPCVCLAISCACC